MRFLPRAIAQILLTLTLCLSALGHACAGDNRVVFATYNLRNYLGDDQAAPENSKTRPKTEEERQALVTIIKEINPDVLGVCEMGSKAMFADFCARLEKAGLGYTHFEWLNGADPDRHLALLSRFPITERNSKAHVPFVLNGKQLECKRGFLDVTIQINANYRLRCVGVHLKSKLPTPEGEALIRRHEASELRRHLDEILNAQPRENLICYGDFNDTKNEPTISEVSAKKGSPTHMADLWARDAVGDRWTHYWQTADQYSRIDYIFVSPGLWPEVLRDSSSVYRGPGWFKASDHRPVYTTLFPFDK